MTYDDDAARTAKVWEKARGLLAEREGLTGMYDQYVLAPDAQRENQLCDLIKRRIAGLEQRGGKVRPTDADAVERHPAGSIERLWATVIAMELCIALRT